jgi:hypothetical protein
LRRFAGLAAIEEDGERLISVVTTANLVGYGANILAASADLAPSDAIG